MGIVSKTVKGGLEAAAEAIAKKLPRKSKAILEAEGYYHPIGGGLKLSKPAQEFKADIVDNPNMPLVPKKIVSPEDLYGKVGIPLVGDRSDTGKLLRGIEGVTFDEPINLEGGFKFGRAHQYEDPNVSSVWASDPGVVTALNNQIKRAAESGKDVLGVSSMGSPTMVDYNTMITQAALNMTDIDGIHPKAIEAFNNEIKNLIKENKKTGKATTPFQNFLGIDNPEVTTQLLSKGAGELRKAFIKTMEKDQYRKLGFPEIAPIRKAVSDAEILDMPLGSTGLEMYKMSPEGNIVEAPKNPHSTYPVHMQGEVFGGLEAPIDYKNMFSTFYEPKRLMSVKDPQAYRAYSLSAPIQEFNQEWLDEVMPIYQQKIKDITGRKKGGAVENNSEQIRDLIKSILGSDVEKAEGGPVAKDAEEYGQQLKEQHKAFISNILNSGKKGITEGLGNIYQSAKETLSHAGTIGDVLEGYGKYAAPMEKARYEGITGTKMPEIKPIPYLPEQSITESPADAKIMPLTTGSQQFAGEIIGDPLSYSMSGAGRGLKKFGKFIGEGLAEAEATGKGPVGKVMQTIVPRMNIIKDPGGMLVGGEKALDEELLNMKKTESHRGLGAWGDMAVDAQDKDPNAVALNQWIDTKVRKYLRNQAGSEADPILKAIDSGVDYNFQPAMGDTKYSVKNKRFAIGKPQEGIAKTDLGKEFEYKVDSMFDPHSTVEIKDILNNPMEFANPATAERRRASLLRVEHDLPIDNEKDVEALRLINHIPDQYVHTLSGTNITERLGLNHVSDVLYEDLRSGKLTPEQLNQMSIEKAIRRTAEYDAQKAKEMAKANAQSIEGMPVPKQYDDGYKWVELKHETDPTKTKSALKSEGEMMGHCVGNYCPEVESGEIKIFSLRSPDGKSHATIEARPQFSMTLWRNANLDAINSNPKLKQYDFNMNSLDNDHKYGYRMTGRDYVTEMTKEMKKLGINPVEPPSYMELHQVKGKQNKRPDEKYQSYISDFIKNNPTKHEIVDVHELDNTNLMNVQDIAETGLVNKDIHMHPEVQKALKIKYPAFNNLMAADKEDMAYDLFKETARDLARQNKTFLDKDDILNHIREKYLTPPKKAKGGPIDLETEFKLRRRYG